MPNEVIRTSVRLDKELKEALDEKAAKLEVSVSYLVRQAIKEYLANHKD